MRSFSARSAGTCTARRATWRIAFWSTRIWGRRGLPTAAPECHQPSRPQLPASVAVHPRLHPKCPQPSPLFPDVDHVPQSLPSGVPPLDQQAHPRWGGPTCHQCGAQHHHLEVRSCNSASPVSTRQKGPPSPDIQGQHTLGEFQILSDLSRAGIRPRAAGKSSISKREKSARERG